MRSSWGLGNDLGTIKAAEADTATRLADGKEVAFVPLTNDENRMFQRWLNLVDNKPFNKYLWDHQDVFAEKATSPNITAPSVEIWMKSDEADPKLPPQLIELLPDGLAVKVHPAKFSGAELDKLRYTLKSQIDLRRSGEKSSSAPSDELDEILATGAPVVDVHREVPQSISIVLDEANQYSKEVESFSLKLADRAKFLNPFAQAMLRFTIGSAPQAKTATRENDPGQIHAGLAWTDSIGGGSICTTNRAIEFNSEQYLITAAHCATTFTPVDGGSPAWKSRIDVPNWTASVANIYTMNNQLIGNQRYFSYHWASGRDIMLVRLANPGLKSWLYQLNPSLNTTYHYGLNGNLSNPYSISYVCMEGAAQSRVNVPGVSGNPATRDSRCANVNLQFYAEQVTEVQGIWTCNGDSGGLVHVADTAVGIVAYSRGTNDCDNNLGFAPLWLNVPAVTTGGGVNTGEGWSFTGISPMSNPANCLYRHPSGAGGLNGGWLQQNICGAWQSIWSPYPMNDGSGEVWGLYSPDGTCFDNPEVNTSYNWLITTQYQCHWSYNQRVRFVPKEYAGVTPSPGPAVGDGSFYMRYVVNESQCVSVRDPYNPNDPHWIHSWQCFYQHPAQLWKLR